MEVDRIRKVADMIEAHPEHFDMHWFLRIHGRNVEEVTCQPTLVGQMDLLSCGMTACIGGWAVGLWPAEIGPTDLMDDAVGRVLGLSWAETRALCYEACNTIRSAADASAHLRGMADDYEAASA